MRTDPTPMFIFVSHEYDIQRRVDGREKKKEDLEQCWDALLVGVLRRHWQARRSLQDFRRPLRKACGGLSGPASVISGAERVILRHRKVPGKYG